ncbi:MAG TPA: hypothetical protein VGG74_10650 [Kofleriaceae bacterium]|jgi:hypothetical protein
MVRRLGICIAVMVSGAGIVAAEKAARDGGRAAQTNGSPSSKWDGKYKVTLDNATTGMLKCPSVDSQRVYTIAKGKLAIPLLATNPAWKDISEEDLGLCTQKPSARACDSYRDTLDKLKAAHLPTDIDAPLGELTITFDAKGVAAGELKTHPLKALDQPDDELAEVIAELADLAVTRGGLRLDHDKYMKGKTGGVSIKTLVPVGSHNIDEACDLDITAIDYKDTRKHIPSHDPHCLPDVHCSDDGECPLGCTTCAAGTCE